MKPCSLLVVPLDALTPDPAQVRRAFGEEELVGLGRSLAAGQLHPILAYRKGDQIIILDGERRWRAAKLGGLKSLDVLLVPEPEGPGDIALAQLAANLQRADLDPVEKAEGIRRVMTETGQSASEVAATLGLSPASVSRLLALLELPGEIQDRVRAGTLAASAAYQIARAGSREAQEALAEKAGKNGLSREALAERVRDGKPQKGRKAAARFQAVLGKGRTITLAGEGLTSLEQLVEWTEELLAKARKVRSKGLELATFAALLRDEAGAGRANGEGGAPC
jgi:ParB family chromosome partitioning protein